MKDMLDARVKSRVSVIGFVTCLGAPAALCSSLAGDLGRLWVYTGPYMVVFGDSNVSQGLEIQPCFSLAAGPGPNCLTHLAS